ncbi:TMEM165/GDT1 family protein [Actinokineospora terrae]|uniref:GDT1 family protein n=1 Tax=Actinokineospora terrae TaxID=155974 RepID=A0A1H9PAD4_9PSEU|nr:TMEM165/GDT1 family protein [Actinokineospora terrae]SER45156.1 Putative Ca2+/H+ antiporter, TMEM165/GDT1 family [Actinokineospora terrae]
MGSALIAFASAFALVLAVELPDKTLVATLILTTRYRALPVFVGVSVAFAVQCVIAAAFGGVLSLLPDQVVAAVVAALFALGAFLLLKEGFAKQEEETAEAQEATPTASFWRAGLTSFGVLFAAEWGDASQIATAGLTARYAEPVWVGLGAWVALVLVAGIAVLVGRKIAERIKPQLIQRVAGFVFVGFALFATYEAIFG